MPLTTNYAYDAANRLTSVDRVAYTWDNNGNASTSSARRLLNDGVNTYTYDSANRLISVSNQSTVSSYQYSGLGDRLSQTVNGNTTNYALDLNTGLTQVLNDGTNTYLYGVGRIAQVNTGTEYFLGDALGSVRQLTDASGEIALAKSYAPYGEVANSAGSAVSPFAFTGEQQDVSGLTYLRARYYSSGDGRFITKDSWAGNVNQPLSLNQWNYTNGNPVNYTDPSGHSREGCVFNPSKNIEYVEKNVGPFLVKSNWLDTYTAAGIAVQCWAVGLPNNDDYDGRGLAQITNKEASTPWGDTITDEDGGDPRGYGLLCYIVMKTIPRYRDVISCTICEDEAYMINNFGIGNYQKEKPHDQTQMRWVVEYMRRRIKLVLDVCERDRKCLNTDKFIAAALAQNGPGFNIINMKTDVPKLNKNEQTPDYKLDWGQFFKDDKGIFKTNTRRQLSRFNLAIQGLTANGWTVPPLDTDYINQLISGIYQ